MRSAILALLHPGPADRAGTRAAAPRLAGRLLVFAALAAVQIVVISYAFNFPKPWLELDPAKALKRLAHVAPVAAVVFLMVAWPRRNELTTLWTRATAAQTWAMALLVNAGLFLAVACASLAFTAHAAAAAEPPWGWFALYCGLLAAAAMSLLAVAAPVRFWLQLVKAAPVELMLAGLSAMAVLAADELSRQSWEALSSATLVAAALLLSLYETGVVGDLGDKMLGIGDFRVLIYPECSGYEGAAIVTVVMALYLLVFRSELRFPQALLLLPIGIAVTWVLNVVRIAALVSLGAHLSPEVALNGFHSQAGSIAFLLVTVGLMAASHRMTFFRAHHVRPKRTGQAGDRLLLALLVPFAALMAAGLVAQAFAPNHQWLYALKVVAVGAVLWRFRDVYAGLVARVSPLSIAAGAAVGIAWIATDPNAAQGGALAGWIAALPAWLAVIWIALRALGAIVMVPIAEELAFRGYLHRALISRNFAAVPQDRFTWLAFVATSVLFGLMHQRWIAGALAGAVYALVMYRSGRLADPIAAHMTSNALIVAWAIAAGHWSLL